MVVGCKNIEFSELKQACKSSETLKQYALDLVPTPLRHIQAIVDNQKYFVALQVRTIQSLPWQTKKTLCESLLCGARVKGVADVIYDYSDILRAIDSELFEQYLEEEDRRAER